MERFEGSSEVKMVAVEGDRVYLWAIVASRAGVKPILTAISDADIRTYSEVTNLVFCCRFQEL